MKIASWGLRGWVWTEALLVWLASLGVLAQFCAVLLSLSGEWPGRKLASVLILSASFSWLAEYIGTHTGFPFGHYTYSPALQPQLGGVPLLIPLAWLMILPPAWAVTQILLNPYRLRLGKWYALTFAILAGLVFTTWDLYLDPQMVAKGLWLWEQVRLPGNSSPGYFGIPWSNYFGWWLVSSLLTLAVGSFLQVWQSEAFLTTASRQRLFLIYILTWIFQAVGLGLFWSQPGPALVGFLGMGVFVVMAWMREKLAWQSLF
jgi:uncharacterized membrane protein